MTFLRLTELHRNSRGEPCGGSTTHHIRADAIYSVRENTPTQSTVLYGPSGGMYLTVELPVFAILTMMKGG